MSLERLASMVIRIKELQDKAHGNQGQTYPEQLELAELKNKLAKMKEENKNSQQTRR
jgi:hypothetical protein